MRRMIILTLLTCLLAFPLSGHAGQQLKVGVFDNPPMAYAVDGGDYRGIFIDLLRQIATREGWELVLVPGTQAEGVERLGRGEIDLFAPLAYSVERDRHLDFNRETVAANWGQLYTSKSQELQSFLALEGKRVAVVSGNIHTLALQEMLQRFGVHVRYLAVDDYRSVFGLLQRREADAGVVGRFFAQQEEQHFQVAATPMIFNPIEVRFAVSEGKHPALLAAIDRQLHLWKEDKSSVYFQIMGTYLGNDHPHAVPRWILWSFAGGGGAAGLLLVLNLVLRAEVRRRTASLAREVEVRRQAETAFAESEQKYRELVEYANSAILKLDTHGTVTFFNEFAERFFGFSKEEIVGRNVVGMIVPKTESSGRDLDAMLAELLRSPELHNMEMENVRKDGERVRMSWSNRPLFDAERNLVGVLSVGQDVTARFSYEQELLFQATHDRLTGLPNRTLFADRMEQAMARHERQKDFVGLMLLDLDNFKMVNDTLGHKAGDDFLNAVVERLQQILRKSDTLARLGGDEFAIVPVGLGNSEQALVMAEKIQAAMAAPFMIADRELYVTGSIGIAVYPQDGDSVDLLLQHADAAMYEAKRAGKNTVFFYTQELNEQMRRRLTLETDLHQAIERDEFMLYYQPQVDLASGRITGMEALLRWRRPDGSVLLPGEFIGALEESGLIIPVGEWVLEQAVRQAKVWLDAGFGPLDLSINICPRHFQCADIVSTVKDILQRTGLPAAHLRLEVTERLLLHDAEEALVKLHELRELGVTISIDDFGTGYSSLSYIKHLPISELKIDREFVMHMAENHSDATIVNTIIGMAENLELRVVAEGVETEAQRQFLIDSGCQTCQGFYFHRPLPIEQLTALLELENREGVLTDSASTQLSGSGVTGG